VFEVIIAIIVVLVKSHGTYRPIHRVETDCKSDFVAIVTGTNEFISFGPLYFFNPCRPSACVRRICLVANIERKRRLF
jgi:hypothetical protein